ncbi:hypothetical protein PILCRDRAFT_86567 [Piloderma croceum F 1598]|uniref:Uncharacterized protein n=1 Tax=Piloderma croceum (strain F 1598) TaxID=765440 RepID=A0A0C3FQH4_PILCF|nr:hypothetical protein PILCRDRAFT_86567 [Piloderma croceum F 1598]
MRILKMASTGPGNDGNGGAGKEMVSLNSANGMPPKSPFSKPAQSNGDDEAIAATEISPPASASTSLHYPLMCTPDMIPHAAEIGAFLRSSLQKIQPEIDVVQYKAEARLSKRGMFCSLARLKSNALSGMLRVEENAETQKVGPVKEFVQRRKKYQLIKQMATLGSVPAQ